MEWRQLFINNMQKCSFECGCLERVTCACKCSNPNLYFCDTHFTRHMRTPGDHVPECMIVQLSGNQTRELLPTLMDFLHYLKRYKRNTMSNTRVLIKCIEKETMKALTHLNELKRIVVDLIAEKSIDKEYYERIQRITNGNHKYISDGAEDMKKIINNLDAFYENYNYNEMWKECNEMIFSRNASGGLVSIDLDTFIMYNLVYAPKIGRFGNACKLSKNLYMFSGGKIYDTITADAYLINIKDKNYEILKKGPEKEGCGSALKNNKVYIFGGINGVFLKSCDTYDLMTKEWSSIAALPQASNSITAATFGKDIILSGYHMSCCYSYNDLTFTNILNLPENKDKIICEGWIYSNSILYKNQDQCLSKWTSYNVISWNNYLWVFCVFKKGQFLYFIDSNDSLMRIDTNLMRVEKINFLVI